jgi:predicted nucleic acid-binding protein
MSTSPPTLCALWSEVWHTLAAHGHQVGAVDDDSVQRLQAHLNQSATQCAEVDAPLWQFAQAFGLPLRDVMLLSMALWAEQTAVRGPQDPTGAVTLRLASQALQLLRVHEATRVDQLVASPLWGRGWLQTHALAPGASWVDHPLQLPSLLALALQGHDRLPSTWQVPTAAVPMPASWSERAREVAESLLPASPAFGQAGGRPCVLVLRHEDRAEGLTWLRALAGALGHRLVGRHGASDASAGPDLADAALPAWLWLTRSLWLIDALQVEGTRLSVPDRAGSTAPVLVLATERLGLELGERRVIECTLPLPEVAERAALWSWALGSIQASSEPGGTSKLQALHPQAWSLAQRHRLGPSAIRAAAQNMQSFAPSSQSAATLVSAAGLDLQGLARWVQPSGVAPVLPAGVKAQVELLHARCLQRDALPQHLSPAASARMGAGVRALLHGPSGTGKTLVAEWLAARLGKPLLVVDTAAITSKYIGETEKNLERVMGGAERVDAVLLFDEADALFARRTDVASSNDRYANAQTNYLLQRLESHIGITLLTSNGRSRIDAAFTRRLDAVIEFTQPSPPERMALWRALLGTSASHLPVTLIERLALDVEAAGGTLRNIVATATVLAGGPLQAETLEVACALECAKTGVSAPAWAVAAYERWLQAGAPLGASLDTAFGKAPEGAEPTEARQARGVLS